MGHMLSMKTLENIKEFYKKIKKDKNDKLKNKLTNMQYEVT